jgi:hypothetical protein
MAEHVVDLGEFSKAPVEFPQELIAMLWGKAAYSFVGTSPSGESINSFTIWQILIRKKHGKQTIG